jgi:integrase
LLLLASLCIVVRMKDATIEHPEESGITIRKIPNVATISGERKEFGFSWLAVVPAKRTHGKGRVRKQFDSLDDAKEWADQQNALLKKAGTGYLELSDKERAQAVGAFHIARDSKLDVDLTTLVQDALAAVKILGASEKLAEAARYWKERKGNVKPMLVADAIAELLKAKTQDGVSDVHHKDLRLRLQNGFSDSFGLTNVSDLDAQRIDEWLRGLDVGKRSRVNYRRVVLTFLRFCERRGWLARGAIDGTMIDVPKVKTNGSIEIFTAEEMARLLAATEDNLVPFIAIGGFAGLRSAELQRLDWSEVRLKDKDAFIEVKAAKAKTASRRLVPISDNLRQWLTPHARKSGPVCPYASMSKQLLWLADAVNEKWQKEKPPGEFKWRHNALRHSFVSYRLAVVQDAAKTALEAGNSPQMVFRHYRELVTPEQAKSWFGIMPTTPANVTNFNAAVG